MLKLSERRVQQLAKDNIIPKAERGKYDLVSSVHGYIDFLKAKAGGDFTAEEVLKNKNKLLKAKAEIAEIEKNEGNRRINTERRSKTHLVRVSTQNKTKIAFNTK